MARIFITGSSEGLGLMAGQLLAEQGHTVVLHARNATRAADVRRALPMAHAVVEGDVSTIAAMRSVAEQANRLGRFDAVIHNVAVGYRQRQRGETDDGLPLLFAVNVMTPYVLTALMERPARLGQRSARGYLRFTASQPVISISMITHRMPGRMPPRSSWITDTPVTVP